MEVHHHPDIEKKNFKQYLLEGLMIFLAVTMGFIAESIRENITKNEKETEYITSLVSNLEKDKLSLNYAIQDNQRKTRGLDSLLALSNHDMKIAANRKLLYKYANYISFYSVFISNDATMSQLKNSGGMQFIRKDHVADSIAKYDQEVHGIYAAEAPYLKYSNDGSDAMTELLIFTLKNDTTKLNGNRYKNYPLLTNDGQKIQVFFNKVDLERGLTENYINNLQERLPIITRLMKLLKSKYDIN